MIFTCRFVAMAVLLLLVSTCWTETTSFTMRMMSAKVKRSNAERTKSSGPRPGGTKRTRRSGNNKNNNVGQGNRNRNRNNTKKIVRHATTPKPKPKRASRYTIEDLSEMSVARAVVESATTEQLLDSAMARMWLPTDEDLPSHLRTQRAHHEKRIGAAGQALRRLGELVGRERGGVAAIHRSGSELWKHAALRRALLAASLPFDGVVDPSSSDHRRETMKETRSALAALVGLHDVAGHTLSRRLRETTATTVDRFDPDVVESMRTLIRRVDRAAYDVSLREAVEVRWAIRGIATRIGRSALSLDDDDDDYEGSSATTEAHWLRRIVPTLERRVSKLPFDVLPLCLDWNDLVEEKRGGDGEDDDAAVERLLSQIPFNFDTITTRDGSLVEERRGTAWVADEGVGSLAYSGKLMTPNSPLPPIVSAAMREVERGLAVYDDDDQARLDAASTRGNAANDGYFDCALCNHYPDDASACKFHTDPEHGTYWERLTCVVSAGNDDVRRFAFRPIPGANDWRRYDGDVAAAKRGDDDDGDDIAPAVVSLFPGDVVRMDGECNDVFHHAVYHRRDDDGRRTSGRGRVSLVFKRAIDRGNGRKGHGVAGKGRRRSRGVKR